MGLPNHSLQDKTLSESKQTLFSLSKVYKHSMLMYSGFRKGQPFFFTLQPFFFTPPFFSTLHLSFSPSEPFFSPSNLFFSPSTLSVLTLDPFFFTLLPLLGVLVGWLQTKYRQPLGKTQGGVALVAWFVGCLVGCQRKASIDSIWGN